MLSPVTYLFFCSKILVFLILTFSACRLIENGYLGLRNGILDQSAILLSRYGCLTFMNCKVNFVSFTYRDVDGCNILIISGMKDTLVNLWS